MKGALHETDVAPVQSVNSKTLTISPRRLALVLFLGAVILIILHVLSKKYVLSGETIGTFVWEFLLHFDLDAEISIPTWYSQTLLLFAACLSGYIALVKYGVRDTYRHYWAILAVVMLYVSVDEGASLHETLGFLELNQSFGMTSPYFNFGWVIPAFFLLSALSLIFVRFWWNLPRRTKTLFAVSAIIYVVGALGIEMISSRYLAINSDWNSLGYQLILIPFEEGLEMFGAILFIYTLADYISSQKIHVNFQIKERE